MDAESPNGLSPLRRFLGHLRRHTARVPRLAGRFTRMVNYGLDLTLWSRIFAAQRRLRKVHIPESEFRHKGLASEPPSLTIENGGERAGVFAHGFGLVYPILLANLQHANLLSPFRHAHPGPAFRGVYLWDSAFIAEIWKHWDAGVARDVLLSVIQLREGDRLQHVVSEFVASAYTQPPVVAWAARRLALTLESPQRREFLGAVYAPLCGFHQWLRRERMLENGLFAWRHPYESGMENAPRFSSRDERELLDTTRLGAPDFCACVLLQLEALAWMARELGHHEEAAAHDERAEALRGAMATYLWHEEDGLFYDRHVDTGEFVRVNTIASLLPLAGGVAEPARARRLRDTIMNPAHYATPMPLPSVSASDPSFEKDMWRGPVWLNTAYLVVEGLKRHGYHDDAAELAYRLGQGVSEVLAAEGEIYEFYDPHRPDSRELRRKRGNLWKTFTLGGKPQRNFVGWTGLVTSLFIETVCGLESRAGAATITPRLPEEATGWKITLNLPRLPGPIRLERQADGTVSVHGPGLREAVLASPGQRVHLDPGKTQPRASCDSAT